MGRPPHRHPQLRRVTRHLPRRRALGAGARAAGRGHAPAPGSACAAGRQPGAALGGLGPDPRGRRATAGYERVALLDGPAGAPVFVERVDATLDVVDRDPLRARSEHFEGLGLLPAHPNWIGQVLADRLEPGRARRIGATASCRRT